MAIDGIILAVTPATEGLRLKLGSRPAETYVAADGSLVTGSPSCVGQDTLLLINPSWAPHVGDEVWGGGGTVHIVSGGISFPYKREGYFRLTQQW
jgi:hypothetical protein